jgi:cation diffusion facilitator family transporter
MTDDITISKENIRIQKIVAVVGVTLFAIKFFAWYITHSLAIYTDMLESIVNIVSAFIGLYSLHFSAQPRDPKHPYGHGKVEFISAAGEGAFVIAAGIAIIYQVITSFNTPHSLSQLNFGIALIALTGAINYGLGYYSIATGKKNNSLALIASGKHLQTDTWTTIGILIGLSLVSLTKLAWLDGVTAFIFAALIIWSGIGILKEAFAGILDASDPELITEVVAYLNQHRRPNWLDMHNLRIIKYGRILHFDAHMTVPGHLTVREAHDELDHIEVLMRQKYGSNVEMFIHLDPSDEKINYESYLKDEWTVEKVLKNAKHVK